MNGLRKRCAVCGTAIDKDSRVECLGCGEAFCVGCADESPDVVCPANELIYPNARFETLWKNIKRQLTGP